MMLILLQQNQPKTNLHIQDSVPLAKFIVGTIAQKEIQKPKLTSKSVDEFDESLYNKDMKEDTNINLQTLVEFEM